ncbi:MAG: NPCBM/NEW2 domain-containing protein [Planctomycetota bacterium]|nr:NPCBM/NEW2 domain-containing protein [Planctomycetota bacterium]
MLRATLSLVLTLPLALHAPLPGEGSEVSIEALDGTRKAIAIDGLELAEMGPKSALLSFLPGPTPAAPEGGFELRLLSGDRVRGEVVGGGEERIDLSLVGGLFASFALEEVSLVLALDDRDRLAQLSPPSEGDRAWRRTGGGFDPLDGFLLGFSPEGVLFEGELGERLIAWSELAALHVEALEPLSPEPGDATPISVDLVDGSRLRGSFAGITSGALALDRGADEPLSIGLELLVQVALDDPRLVFLGDLAFEDLGPNGLFDDGFGLAWPPRVDRAVGGGPLRVDGRTHARGLGVHAPSRLAFDLPAGGTLRGAVGVDDSVLRLPADGSVIFRVFHAGELVWESEELSSGSPAVELPALELTETGRLELEVDAASNSITGDRANWLDLRIVRAGR